MDRLLNINAYLNAYKRKHSGCFDIPAFAALAGYYGYEYYYYYCFYISVFYNWTNFLSLGYFDFRAKVLEKIGLKLVFNKVANEDDLLDFIKKKVDERIPLVLPIRNNAIFYKPEYMEMERKEVHPIVLEGYSTLKPHFYLRDTSIINENNLNSTRGIKGEGLYGFQVSRDILLDMWRISNEQYRAEKSELYNTVLTIESIGRNTISCYEDLAADLLNYSKTGYSALAKFILTYNNNIESIRPNINFFRKCFSNSLIMVMDALEKAFNVLFRDQAHYAEFLQKRWEFLRTRETIMNNINFRVIKGSKLNPNEKANLIDMAIEADELFFDMVEQNLKFLDYAKRNPAEKNFVLEADITSDSEHIFADEFKAIAVADEQEDTRWYSMGDTWDHWIEFDLKKRRRINRIIIKHSEEPEEITVSYKIQGKNEGKNWEDILAVFENSQRINHFSFTNVEYRYIRLYILKGSPERAESCISSVELWGNDISTYDE